MCLYPKQGINKKYIPNKKNGWKAPECKDERLKYVAIGCGNCIECRNQKKREWQARMQNEMKVDKRGKFITLTFSEEELKTLCEEISSWPEEKRKRDKKTTDKKRVGANEVARVAVRRFCERWRKEYKKAPKHWFVTELGHKGTERIHMHGILWTEENNETIKRIWKYGGIWVGEYCNEKTVNYIVKYVTKVDEDHKGYQSKIFVSHGIGAEYTKTFDAKQNKYKPNGKTDNTFKLSNGASVAIPIYWRNKIYSEEEREKLWLESLNKGERYIMGQKINIKTEEGYREYEKALVYNQLKYKKMGYGDGTWKKKEYFAKNKSLNNLENKKE